MSETLNILMELLNEYRLSECALDEGMVSWYAARLDGRTEDERMDERMSITNKLRKWVNERFVGLFSSEWVSDLNAIADRIDVEYAAYRAAVSAIPKEYVKLPVDADGVPIHVGDELTDGKVARLLICDDAEENSVYVYESPHVIKQIYCYEVVHRKPDSWDGIISDAVILGRQLEWLDNSRGDAGSERELVERCRRLAGEGA